MAAMMDSSTDKQLEAHRLEITYRFLVEDTLKALRSFMKLNHAVDASVKQYNDKLRSWGIYKAFNHDETKELLEIFQHSFPEGEHVWFVIIQGVLLDQKQIEEKVKYVAKKTKKAQQGEVQCVPRGRHLVCIQFPLRAKILYQGGYFETLRRLLFYVSVHYDSSLEGEYPIWMVDEESKLRARNGPFKDELKTLSLTHNIFVRAFNQLKKSDVQNGMVSLNDSLISLNEALVARHPRQILDILAILALAYELDEVLKVKEISTGVSSIAEMLTNRLTGHESKLLFMNRHDPRRIMLETFPEIPSDAIGYMYLTLDTVCREIWTRRVKQHDSEIAAYYSFNQAAFPRLWFNEAFYEPFRDKSIEKIIAYLRKANARFPVGTEPSYCLWHTAFNYLYSKDRYVDADHLCDLLRAHEAFTDLHDPQFNHYVSLTYYYLGQTQEARGKLTDAVERYQEAMNKRYMLGSHDPRDPTQRIIVQALNDTASKLGAQYHAESTISSDCLKSSDAALKESYDERRASTSRRI